LLYVALHIAARDRRITDEAWRNLEPGRKAILLPLPDDDALREAAQYVSAMKLTQRATRRYVTSLLAAREVSPRRRVTAPRVTAELRRFRDRVTGKAVERRMLTALRDADEAQGAAARKELEAVRAWADRLLRQLRER
jgi:hypothetical protein